MKDFILRNKAFLGVITLTLVLLFGGVALFSKNSPSTSKNSDKISLSILNTKDSYKTGGIVLGNYLPELTDAKVNLVEFGDYQCPACGAYHTIVKQLLTDMPGKINFIFRNFPLPQHKNSTISSLAAEAAGMQGKFWQMHDKIYENQNSWSDSTNAKDIFIGYADSLGLNVEKFKLNLDSKALSDKVKSDSNDGTLAKVNSTPTFYLNGTKLDNPGGLDDLKKIVEEAVKLP